MKKSLLLLASFLMSVASFAQWTAPAPSTIQEMATDGTAQFLYNKEAGGFFAGGNDWGTRASVSTVADSVKFVVADGELYNFACYPAAKNSWLYVSCNNYDAMWVDAPNADSNTNYPGTDSWQISKNANGSYKITNILYDGSFGVAEIYRGEKGNTRTYINDPLDEYDVNGELMPSVAGNFYNEWYFIDAAEYEALQPKVITYLAAINLEGAISRVKLQDETYDTSVLNAVFNNTSSTKEELDEAAAVAEAAIAFSKALAAAQATYSNLDFSAPIAVYKNNKSTKEELEAAKGQIQEIINNYLATQASFDDPISFDLFGSDGVDVGKWTRVFTGEGEVGTWHTNTWSTEANGGADGTDMVTPFCEDWVGSGSLLSDQKIYQVLAGAAPGLYKFHANVRLYNEAGGVDALTGCTMYFGDNQIDLSSKVSMYKSGNKCVLWKNGGFDIIAIVTETTDIEFGFDIKDPTFNWMAFKDLSVKFYGNEDVEANALLLIKGDEVYEKYEEGEAYQGVVDAYNAAVDAYDAAATADEINAAVTNIQAAKAELDANIQAYKNLNAKIEEWEALVGKNNDLIGAEWDEFCDFMMGEEVEGYPTPAIPEIEYSLTTEEVEKYIEEVDQLYAAAVAACIVPGADCTHMLTNPGYTDGEKGWTIGGNCNNKRLGGGLIPSANYPNAGCPVAESWHSTFDIYQEIDGVQDGIYSLSLNGFCRLDDGVDTEVPAFIYMNDFATRLMNIEEGKISADEAIDGYNCYLTAAADGPWSTNPIFEGAISSSPANNVDSSDGAYYWPNGMEGASVAFSAGRYEAKVYGLVEGGKMRLGIRNLTSTHVWALWGNFKLTYEGKSEDALNSILPLYSEKLATYVEENEITSPVREEVDKALAIGEDAADLDEKYEALIEINKAITIAEENAEAVKAYINAFETLGNAVDISENTEAINIFNQNVDRFSAYENLTTAGLVALTEEINLLAGKLNAPSEVGDWTSVIKNPAFDDANAEGWNYGFEPISNIGYQQNQTYTNSESGVTLSQFIEGWRSGNAAIGDGSINQVIPYLATGAYTLSVDAIANLQSISDDSWMEEVTGVYLYVKQNGEIVAKQEIKTANGQPQHFTLDFAVAEGAVEIGIMAESTTANWIAADNWALECTSLDPGALVSISGVNASAYSAAGIYTLSGARVANIQKGVNIIKMADGTVKKVLK